MADRFWAKVARGEGCWEWLASRTAKGYGKFGLEQKAGWISAHRASWVLAHGPVPDGLSVLHRCDNPPCVRPDHLFLGTAGDNIRDAAAKGRLWAQTNPERWQATVNSWPTKQGHS